MKKQSKTILKTIISIVVIVLIAWWGWSAWQQKANQVPPTEIEVLEEHIKGNVESQVILTEFNDMQCPACKSVQPLVKQLLDEYDVKFVYKHFPLRSIHPNAQIAAQALESAGVQGMFWEMHDLLFEKQDEWSSSINAKKIFTEYAESLGLNTDQFVADLKNKKILARINSDVREAELLKIPGTPTFFVNNIQVSSFDELVPMIQEAS